MEFIQRSERWLNLDDLENEIWKDVVGYESLYEVSNYGRVRTHENKTTSSARFKEDIGNNEFYIYSRLTKYMVGMLKETSD